MIINLSVFLDNKELRLLFKFWEFPWDYNRIRPAMQATGETVSTKGSGVAQKEKRPHTEVADI